MVLLLIGTAVAPVFSETDESIQDLPYEALLKNRALQANSVKVNVQGDSDTQTETFDGYYKDFIEFMVDFAQDNYYKDVDKQALIEGAYKGIFDVLDQHSMYFTPKEYAAFSTDLEGEFSGIGAVITDGPEYVEIVSPIKDTPAFEAGIMPGDKIASIDGKDAKGMSKEEAVMLIRGNVGTTVKLGIIRSGSADVLYISIVRAVIKVETVDYKVLENGIGYIEISQFGDNTNEEFDAAMKSMKEQGVKKLIVDVRNNPGGYLTSAIHISDYFVEKGKEIVRVDYRDESDQIYRAETEKTDMQLVVLVNEGSASASEIFSGTVQQNKTGTIIGNLTYGKGTVQNMVPLTNGGGIKITIAEYLLPNQYHVDKNGVHPDILIHGVDESEVTLYNSFIPMSEKMSKYRGEISLNVYGAQQRLKFLGYNLEIDGLFGAGTEVAIKDFQKTFGLKSNGVLTIETVRALDEQVAKIMTGELDPQLDKAVEVLLAK